MTRHDSLSHMPHDTPPPRRPSRLFRWTIRVLFVLCGAFMLLVLLSEPRVSARVSGVIDEARALWLAPPATPVAQAADTGLRVGVAPELDATAETEATPARPAVRVLPESRVPVRRAGE